MAPDNDDLMGVQVDLALFAADSALQRHRSAGDLVAARRSRGLPIGLQFVAPYAREDLLLARRAVEQYRWADERALCT